MSAKYDIVPSDSAVTGVPMVRIEAPATLSPGFRFDALYDGQAFSVTVPPEGVTKGQMIAVPFTPTMKVVEAEPINNRSENILGHWKDGLCDCCKFGCFHPHLWNAWCFPVVLMGQVLTRMKMNWLGNAALEETEWRSAFRKTLYVTIGYFVLRTIFKVPPATLQFVDGHYEKVFPDVPIWKIIIHKVLILTFAIYVLTVLTKLRRAVRAKYSIPEERCLGCEDLCCSLWCTCCTAAQLARQTADYEVQHAQCCTSTGCVPDPSDSTV